MDTLEQYHSEPIMGSEIMAGDHDMLELQRGLAGLGGISSDEEDPSVDTVQEAFGSLTVPDFPRSGLSL